MKLDVLFLAAHPDDVELACAGTIAKMVQDGKKVGILDFTRGDLGSRGNPDLRLEEATKAAEILGIHFRHNLGFRDGFFINNEDHQLQIIKWIRFLKPDIVIANAPEDRHPDHGKAAKLAVDACFLSGLKKIQTEDPTNGEMQEHWRPIQMLHYIQDKYLEPSLVIDISEFWEVKKKAILAFKSQFYDPENKEPNTYISNPDFLLFIESRAREMGHKIECSYGEGFISTKTIKLNKLTDLI